MTIDKNEILNVEYKRILTQIHRGIPRLNRYPITQVMGSRSAVLGSHSERHWNYGKIEHVNGIKM